MPEYMQHPPHTFSWIDLSTSDAEDAKRFYAALFDWEYRDAPLPGGGAYTMLHRAGKRVAGLGQMQPEQMEQGQPSVWISYVSVEDIDETVERARKAGGNVFMGPMEVMEEGKLALVMDPTGAVVGLWEPRNHTGATLKNETGSLAWNEVYSSDPERAEQFYRDTFGWDVREDEMGDGITYTTFYSGEEPVGGMVEIAGDLQDVPPHWAHYIAVDNVAATVSQTEGLGGKVLMPAQTFPGGEFAVLEDPQGAVFYVLTMAYTGEPS